MGDTLVTWGPVETTRVLAASLRRHLADLLVLGALLTAGAALRLHYFAGFGYGDDQIFRGWVQHCLERGALAQDNQTYRFTWWIPTLWSVRALGMTEWALVLPYFVYSLTGIVVLYLLAYRLWGRLAAAIAALLLVVHPLDLTFATMLTNDIALSVFMALTILLAFAACDTESEVARRRYWMATAAALLLCYHSKVTGVLMFPVVGAIVLLRRQAVASFAPLVGSVVVLFGADGLVSLALHGTPFGPFNAELRSQALLNPDIVRLKALSWHKLAIFPAFLFARNSVGSYMHGFYPHALVLAALLARPLRLRTEPALWVWLAVIFLGMEFNLQRANGFWVVGFRNMRHTHVFVYPVVILLAGYLTGAVRRWPRAGGAVLVLVVVATFHEAVAAGRMGRAVFGDGRVGCAHLRRFRPGPLTIDSNLRWRCDVMPKGGLDGWIVHSLSQDVKAWPNVLAHLRSGFVVTGGGRKPNWYGGNTPVPRAADVPQDRSSLLLEIPGPTSEVWRPELLRIWYVWPLGVSVCHQLPMAEDRPATA